MKKSEEITDKLATALIAACHEQGLNTTDPDFVLRHGMGSQVSTSDS